MWYVSWLDLILFCFVFVRSFFHGWLSQAWNQVSTYIHTYILSLQSPGRGNQLLPLFFLEKGGGGQIRCVAHKLCKVPPHINNIRRWKKKREREREKKKKKVSAIVIVMVMDKCMYNTVHIKVRTFKCTYGGFWSVPYVF